MSRDPMLEREVGDQRWCTYGQHWADKSEFRMQRYRETNRRGHWRQYLRSECKPCENARRQRWREEHPDQERRTNAASHRRIRARARLLQSG